MGITPEELSQKIKEAQSREQAGAPRLKRGFSRESNAALKVGTDFAAALVVGVVLGYWIDRWLDTKPFGIILFLFLGFGAGFMNIYRAQTKKQDGQGKK
jgi:ATP synthase protein I